MTNVEVYLVIDPDDYMCESDLDLWMSRRSERVDGYEPFVVGSVKERHNELLSLESVKDDIVIYDFDNLPFTGAEHLVSRLAQIVRNSGGTLALGGSRFTYVMGIALEWAGPRGAYAVINVR